MLMFLDLKLSVVVDVLLFWLLYQNIERNFVQLSGHTDDVL
jgi:hypothetical protein